jgi:hypothetical protein
VPFVREPHKGAGGNLTKGLEVSSQRATVSSYAASEAANRALCDAAERLTVPFVREPHKGAGGNLTKGLEVSSQRATVSSYAASVAPNPCPCEVPSQGAGKRL